MKRPNDDDFCCCCHGEWLQVDQVIKNMQWKLDFSHWGYWQFRPEFLKVSNMQTKCKLHTQGNDTDEPAGFNTCLHPGYGTPQSSMPNTYHGYPKVHITPWVMLHLIMLYQLVLTIPSAVLQYNH